MQIANVTQFVGFINAHGLINTDGIFRQIVQCVNTYASSCNCYKVRDKQMMYANCNKLYADSVKHILPRMKNELLAKIADRQITFLADNGTIISILSR